MIFSIPCIQTHRVKSYYQCIITQDLLLKENFTNICEIPRIDKIVLNTTSNAYASDKKNIISTLLALEMITTQKAAITVAKNSLAPFKIRANQILGSKVTLRKNAMYIFVDLLTTILLPRLRDFSKIPISSIDHLGNISLGLTHLLTFPQLENHFEYFQNFRGLNINFSSIRSHKKLSLLVYSGFQLPL